MGVGKYPIWSSKNRYAWRYLGIDTVSHAGLNDLPQAKVDPDKDSDGRF